MSQRMAALRNSDLSNVCAPGLEGAGLANSLLRAPEAVGGRFEEPAELRFLSGEVSMVLGVAGWISGEADPVDMAGGGKCWSCDLRLRAFSSLRGDIGDSSRWLSPRLLLPACASPPLYFTKRLGNVADSRRAMVDSRRDDDISLCVEKDFGLPIIVASGLAIPVCPGLDLVDGGLPLSNPQSICLTAGSEGRRPVL